jgi:hypothetical protein
MLNDIPGFGIGSNPVNKFLTFCIRPIVAAVAINSGVSMTVNMVIIVHRIIGMSIQIPAQDLE